MTSAFTLAPARNPLPNGTFGDIGAFFHVRTRDAGLETRLELPYDHSAARHVAEGSLRLIERSGVEIVPSPPEQATAPACDHAPARLSWARLLKRVFDIEHCPNCGGSLKSIACPEPRRRAAIEDPPVIVKILAHLGLPTRAPPRSPAQRFDLFQTI